MNHTRLFLILFFQFVIFSEITFAQHNEKNGHSSGKIFGKITDSNTGKALEYATLGLQRVSDSSILAGVVTNAKGRFQFENVVNGVFVLRISFLGYNTFTTASILLKQEDNFIDLGLIKLMQQGKKLNQVEIKGEKSDFTIQLDKKTYSVEKNLTNVGGTASEVLQNIPSVSIDMEGKVSLRGSENVTILIDGKASTITGGNRQAVLQQLPASAISEVEIITNPSAKYDADGQAGIINIKTKKDKTKGVNGNVQASLGTNDKYNITFGLNNRREKYNAYCNYTFRHEKRDMNGLGAQINYLPLDTFSFKSNYNGYTFNDLNNGKIGLDLFLNNYNTLGFSANINSNIQQKNEEIEYNYFDANSPMPSLNRNNLGNENNFTIDAASDYRRVFKKNKSEFTSSVLFSTNIKSINDDYKLIGVAYSDMPFQINKNTAQFSNFIIQADYILPLNKVAKFETGLKSTNRNIDNNQRGSKFDTLNKTYVSDFRFVNHLVFNEQVNAAYALYMGKKNKLEYQLGLRGEWAFIEGNNITNNTKFDNNYPGIFPSGFLKYTFSNDQVFQVNYSRRVNRPNFESLNPVIDYSDSVNLRKGNPKLMPEYINSFEINYSKQIKSLSINATFYYRNTENIISRFRTVDSLSGQGIMSFYNFNSSQNIGAEIILRYTSNKFGSLMLSSNAFQNKINASNVQTSLQSEIVTWNVKLMYNTKIGKSTFVQIAGVYNAPIRSGQSTVWGMMNAADIGIRRDLFKGAASLGINLTDVFNTRQFEISQDGINFHYEGMRKRESRVATVSFTYRFGTESNVLIKKKPIQIQQSENTEQGF